uniref:Uncharacterized protein n=1 Tax=Octopus bimaculoides TaxID=37653 RepID=A0A0L8G4K9_OCTBM
MSILAVFLAMMYDGRKREKLKTREQEIKKKTASLIIIIIIIINLVIFFQKISYFSNALTAQWKRKSVSTNSLGFTYMTYHSISVCICTHTHTHTQTHV